MKTRLVGPIVCGLVALVAWSGSPAVAAPPAPTIQFSSAAYTRAEDGGAAVITLVRSQKSGTSSVRVRTFDGSATSADYVAVDTTVTFNPGQTVRTVNVEILNDALAEPSEFVNLVLGPEVKGAQLGAKKATTLTATLTITDSDVGPPPSPTVSVDDPAPVAEGTDVIFTVSLSAAASDDVAVSYTTVDGTAVAGADYLSSSGTVTIPAGATSATIPISTLPDGLAEGAETFTLSLAGGSIADGSGTGTISANDPFVDADGDGHVPPADCNDAERSVHPGAADEPDLTFTDANCDGIDGNPASAVFVATTGDDANAGTMSAPKRTVRAAVAAAVGPPARSVYLAQGQYDEGDGVALASGVGLFGGYAAGSWARATTNVSEIAGAPHAAVADGDTGVVLQLLRLQGHQAVTAEPSVYGLLAVGGSVLRLEAVEARAARAKAGAPGSGPSVQAPSGGPGSAGLPGVEDSTGIGCSSGSQPLGAPGGGGPRPGGRGGDAGHGELSGSPGSAGAGGAPGGSGGPTHGDGGNGAPGSPGLSGANGSPGSASFTVTGYASSRGGAGTPASPGVAAEVAVAAAAGPTPATPTEEAVAAAVVVVPEAPVPPAVSPVGLRSPCTWAPATRSSTLAPPSSPAVGGPVATVAPARPGAGVAQVVLGTSTAGRMNRTTRGTAAWAVPAAPAARVAPAVAAPEGHRRGWFSREAPRRR